MPAPFKLDQPLTIVRSADGTFREPSREVPPNPLDAEQRGQQPQRWAPGIGTATAPVHGPALGEPPAKAPAVKPFRIG